MSVSSGPPLSVPSLSFDHQRIQEADTTVVKVVQSMRLVRKSSLSFCIARLRYNSVRASLRTASKKAGFRSHVVCLCSRVGRALCRDFIKPWVRSCQIQGETKSTELGPSASVSSRFRLFRCLGLTAMKQQSYLFSVFPEWEIPFPVTVGLSSQRERHNPQTQTEPRLQARANGLFSHHPFGQCPSCCMCVHSVSDVTCFHFIHSCP
jgi:hypothetical protein